MAVITCTATNATDSSEMLRCSPVTTNLGRPGRRPCRFTSTPSSTTAVSSSRLTTPVARLAYHSAVLPVIPFMSHPSAASLLWEEHDRPGAAPPLAHLSIGSERLACPNPDPARGRRECIRYTYESANVAASHRRYWFLKTSGVPSRWRPHARAARAACREAAWRGRDVRGCRAAAAAPGFPAAVGRAAGVPGWQPAHGRGRGLPDVPADRLYGHGRPGQSRAAGPAAGRLAARGPVGGCVGAASGHAVPPRAAGGPLRGAGRHPAAAPAALPPQSAAFQVTSVVGPAAGLLLIAQAGFALDYWLNVASFGVAF